MRSRSSCRHTTVHRQEAITTGKAFGGKHALQPVLGGAILGEKNDAFLGPGPVGPDRVVGARQ